MNLGDYFAGHEGVGILSTADNHGQVDAAVYAKPHFIDENTVAFIMADKYSHHNIRLNPHAVYLFKEKGESYKGKRLYLTRISESEDKVLIDNLRRSVHCWPVNKDCDSEKRFLVSFRVNAVRPLVGEHEGADDIGV